MIWTGWDNFEPSGRTLMISPRSADLLLGFAMNKRGVNTKNASTLGEERSLNSDNKKSNLSFRIRTPLNTISMLASHLMEKAPSKELESLKAIHVAVKEITEALESLAGDASALSTTLPKQAKQPDSSAPSSTAPAANQEVIKGKRILVVEDHKTNQVLLVRLLEEAGATVKAVESGEDALEEIRVGSAFNIILMDVHLPGISGFEATRRLKKNAESSKVPILAMTALSLQSDKDKCFEAGMDGYIGKPIKKEDLLSAIMLLAL